MSDLHHGTGEAFEISPRTSIAHVKLRVYDIQRSLDFYEQLLGFKTIGRISDENVFLSAWMGYTTLSYPPFESG